VLRGKRNSSNNLGFNEKSYTEKHNEGVLTNNLILGNDDKVNDNKRNTLRFSLLLAHSLTNNFDKPSDSVSLLIVFCLIFKQNAESLLLKETPKAKTKETIYDRLNSILHIRNEKKPNTFF